MKNDKNSVTPSVRILPAKENQSELYFAQTPEEDERQGAIGHLRIDFGHGGTEWWSTWHPRGASELCSQEFSNELDTVVNELRKNGLLRNLASMKEYCRTHGGEISGGIYQNYGYEVDSERYQYRIRCNPVPGDYQCYISCFDKAQQLQVHQKQVVGKLSFANGDLLQYENADDFIKAVEEELPYHPTTGLNVEVCTQDPVVRKAVDDLLYDLYGDENPRSLEDYERTVPRNLNNKIAEGLPDLCFTTLQTTGELICLKRGEMGYFRSDWSAADRQTNEEKADMLNERLGVTPEQKQAMEIGSMFGWHVPGANPEIYQQSTSESSQSNSEGISL